MIDRLQDDTWREIDRLAFSADGTTLLVSPPTKAARPRSGFTVLNCLVGTGMPRPYAHPASQHIKLALVTNRIDTGVPGGGSGRFCVTRT